MTPAAAVHIYPGSPPRCSRCRPSPPRTYSGDIILAAAHHAAGHRQSQCPGCGYWRWPWEYPEPEAAPTGLKWSYHEPSKSWLLPGVGRVVRTPGSSCWYAVRLRRDSAGRLCGHSIASGTLTDCARALVAADTGPRNNLQM